MSLSMEQIAQILETPLGGYQEYSDVEVVKHRRRIQQMYSELKNDMGMGYGEASLRARTQWLHEAQQHGEMW